MQDKEQPGTDLLSAANRRFGEAVEILREQETESDMEELWQEGPVMLNEEDPPVKRLSIL